MKAKLRLPTIRLLNLFFVGMVLALWLPATGHGFTATAQVDKTRVVPGEMVSLSIVVDGGKATVDLSPVRDFQIVSSGTSTSQSYTNGQWHHQVVYQYQLVPEKTGVLKIPPLGVSNGKESVLTEEIQILVSEESPGADQPRQIYVEAHVASSDLVVGQQTVYTIKLFAAQRFARASLKAPEFESLAAQELENRKNYTQTINGIPYQVSEISYILQAEKPGRVEIGPAVIMADVIQNAGRDPIDSLFNDSFFSSARTKPIRVASNGVVIDVKPLPPYTGQDEFSGLVGQFSIGATIDKTTLSAGESVTLTLTIQGRGNIMDAGPPPLKLDPKVVKVYDDTPTEEMTATALGFSGKKIFKRALVPIQAGPLSIPGFSLTYFDVTQKSYKTVKTDPIVLDVLGGGPILTTDSGPGHDLKGLGNGNDDRAGQKQEVVMENKDILDIKESISILSTPFQLNFSLFVLLMLSPGLAYGCMAFFFRFKTREKSNETRMTLRSRQALKRAEKLAASDKPFLNHLQTALIAAILAKADKQAESLTGDEAKQILGQTNTKESVIDEVVTLLSTLDAGRFSGQTLADSTIDISPGRVKQIIKMLSIALLSMGLLLHDGPVAFASDRTEPVVSKNLVDLTLPFINGIKQYRIGEFKEAAHSFETIAALGVVNPDLFYNIGNAYLKAQDLGQAILWYERAKRLAPSDPDLLFNLAHANSLVKDKIDSSVTLSDILFFWQGIVPLKWFQAGAIIFSCLFFLWAGVQTLGKKPVFSGPGRGLMFFLILFFLGACLEDYRGRAENMAVIVQDSAAVRSGTMETATQLFELHAGTKVQVRAKKNGYL
ncbi:MAG: BatD family protein, partial [Proteobacteria bacterium]|nr:BatD family protein [Pseudomonadota bacterium]